MAVTLVESSDIGLLTCIAEHRVLTSRQLAAIERRNVRALRRRLRYLDRNGLIRREPGPLRQARGRPELVVSLSLDGAGFLAERGVLDPRIDPARVVAPSRRLVAHELFVNETRVALTQLSHSMPELTIRFVSPMSPWAPRWTPGRSFLCERFRGPEGQRFELVPDGAISVTHTELAKTLLFFLEVDTGTEPLSSGSENRSDLWHKIVKYQAYLASRRYRRFETLWECSLKGFRLLIVTSTRSRCAAVCRLLREMRGTTLAMTTDCESLLRSGFGADVWVVGGQVDAARASVLGSKMPNRACI